MEHRYEPSPLGPEEDAYYPSSETSPEIELEPRIPSRPGESNVLDRYLAPGEGAMPAFAGLVQRPGESGVQTDDEYDAAEAAEEYELLKEYDFREFDVYDEDDE